jgi:hypothetical protein
MTEDTLKEYAEYLQTLDEKEREIIKKTYFPDPKILAKEIIKTHKALNFGKAPEEKKELTAEEKKKLEKEAHDKQVNLLKKNTKTFIQSASSPREKVEETPTDEDAPYKNLILKGQQQLQEKRAEE